MIRWLRTWLASKLDPVAARDAERYFWLVSEITYAQRWLGEFSDVDATLQWIVDKDTNRWRHIDTKAVGVYPSDVSSFREILRSGAHRRLIATSRGATGRSGV